ncbi:MAG TPA: histidine kinase dimerization/phosphoacceptor domain -containing protein [Acidisarcina sp.]
MGSLYPSLPWRRVLSILSTCRELARKQRSAARLTAAAFIAVAAVSAAAVSAWPGMVTKIASTTYLPHGFCYLWNRQLLALHVVSDTAIWISYLAISVTLTYIVFRNRKAVPFSGIFVAFGAFIIACGFTHFMDVVVLWIPLYWLAGDIKLITAIASCSTAVTLIVLVPRIGELLTDVKNSQANERRFLAASNSSLDALYLFESVRDQAGNIADFKIVFVNSNGANLVSSTPRMLQGRVLSEVLPIDRSGGFFLKYKAVVETGEPLVEESPIEAHDVEASWLRCQAVKLEDGFALTVGNISERVEAQLYVIRMETRLKAEENFHRMIEATPTAMAVVNSDGKIEVVNRGMEISFGYPCAELLTMSLEQLVPVRFRKDRNDPKPAPAPGSAPYPFEGAEFCGQRKGGAEFPFEISFSPIVTDQGVKVLAAIVDISDRRQKELKVRAALREKDILLGEIHHRVKNNLQIIHSLLGLQSSQVRNPVAVALLRASQNRIKSMALIHQTLYQSKDYANVDFEVFLNALASNLIESYFYDSERVNISIHANDVHLPINAAIPCGLLVNELVCNSLKHAFPGDRRGSIDIEILQKADDDILLSVSDDGVGIAETLDFEEMSSLGLKLVNLLTDQLHGKLEVHRSAPTRFLVSFPLPKPSAQEASYYSHITSRQPSESRL